MNRVDEHLRKTAKVIKYGLEFKKSFIELYKSLDDLSEEEINQLTSHPDSLELKKHMDIVEDFMKQIIGIIPYKEENK